MAYKEDAAYYGLDFNPHTVEEGLEALKKIERMGEAYKPLVAEAALRYFSVVTTGIAECNYRHYLTGHVRGKMAVLTGRHSSSYINSWGYKSAFVQAINLMIDHSGRYFKYKAYMDKNIPYSEILEAEYNKQECR